MNVLGYTPSLLSISSTPRCMDPSSKPQLCSVLLPSGGPDLDMCSEDLRHSAEMMTLFNSINTKQINLFSFTIISYYAYFFFVTAAHI